MISASPFHINHDYLMIINRGTDKTGLKSTRKAIFMSLQKGTLFFFIFVYSYTTKVLHKHENCSDLKL